jgi:hypothetical protein
LGLHIYTGSLVRFFTNDWENEIQKMSRHNGIEYRTHYANGEPKWSTRPEAESFVTWLRGTFAAKRGVAPDQLLWTDDASDYQTFKLHDEGREAIAILSAYQFRPDLTLPKRMPAEPYDDPAVTDAQLQGYMFEALLPFDAELLIPGTFEDVSFVQDALGRKRLCCSTQRLRLALQRIRSQAFGNEPDFPTWLAEGLCYARGSGEVLPDGTMKKEIEPEGSLARNAMFGFAVYSTILDFSDRHGAAIVVG